MKGHSDKKKKSHWAGAQFYESIGGTGDHMSY